MTDNEKKFLQELLTISVKYQVQVGGCGCCGSPYLHQLKPKEIHPGAGYFIEDDGTNIEWVASTDGYKWEEVANRIAVKIT